MSDAFSFDLARQDVSHALSTVSSVCAQVKLDTLLLHPAPLVTTTPEGRRRVETLASFLDAAYGYRLHDDRLTRYAPSAGARYPTEVVTVARVDGRWRCAIFDFAERIFHEAADDRPGRDVAAFLGLEPDAAFIGAISVLWRTVQRYGMRGHRYCIVDAACVVSNLVELARDAGDDPVCIGPARCAAATRLMDLPASAPVVAGVRLDLARMEPPGDPRPDPGDALARLVVREETPAMSPLLKRVELFHARASLEAAEADYRPPAVSAPVRPPRLWAARRHSMKEGLAAPLPERTETDLIGHLWALVAQPPAPGRVRLSFAYLRFSGTRRLEEAWRYDASGAAAVTILRDADCEEIAERCFEGQGVIRAAASLVLVGPGRDDLSGHGAYLDACHQVGFAIPEFYRIAVALGISSTAIGGYSWNALSDYLLLPDFYPLMAHAFGRPSRPGGKQDTDAWQSHALAPGAAPGSRNPKSSSRRSS
ncbi:hypothetical protein [Arenibaculum sp.]|uniref:hypothetical protein n=1 Tax=Arenibaculum sp. TaxID=2865862 RepID=UPI002E10A886|nr:hypothetical protein [Arenibaculum sp.]